jgi:uncharacterized coiled-coil protein SlyX
VEELDATSADQQKEISELTQKVQELQGGNITLQKQVEKFSGDA